MPFGKKTGDSKKYLMQILPDQLKGIGKLLSKYRIDLKDDVVCIQLPARNVPEALRQPLKEQLDHLEKIGVIV